MEWGEVDGVPVVYLPAGQHAGPLRANLLFGVGRNEEHLQNSGITHAVEHLTLQPIGKTPYYWNGSVGLVSTSFTVMGEPDQVVSHLAQVASLLREPRVERLTHELQIMHVEAEGRQGTRGVFDLSIRFGPHGVGLPAWEEFGLRSLQPDDVVQWAQTWFTRCNAALWLSGPPPSGLQLKDLPLGDPVERPLSRPVTHGPKFVRLDTRLSSMSVVADGDHWGLGTALSIARDRAQLRLRDRDALSYNIVHDNARLNAGLIHSLSADGGEGTQQQIFDGLVEILQELAETGPTEAELAEVNQARSQRYADPRAALHHLNALCERHLLGLPNVALDEVNDRLSALTSEDCRNDLQKCMPTVLAVGAQDIKAPPTWLEHDDWSATTVQGETYTPYESRERGELVVGSEGLSWALDVDHRQTTLWDDVVGCLWWGNGVRTVIGPTGDTVVVIPWNWRAGTDLPSVVDAHIPPALHIDMGEGEFLHRTDPDDAGSLVDVRWLASIIGTFCEQQQADVVIDTDGVFVLFRKSDVRGVDARLQSLRSLGRKVLISEHDGNRWIPERDILEVKFSKRPLAKVATVKATLKLTTTSERFQVDLVNQNQIDLATTWLGALLGPRFVR